ncbi:hypothetical protein M378DRAFT_11435 [Amanita muscaria Koide BX008]|uniref:DUF6533 domain-containing protein n=1 Tax=Amanita muscaria (strain Koide BX008) TaxID=946122 RepID=A0A0C2SME2_AMAMK|nr:hypothetical protein M378DRAFT_11435 [Amanita muscaria Koide BX008]
MSAISEAEFINLFRANLIPAYVILFSLTWIIYDYFLTLDDEVKLVWPQRWSRGKILFLFVRYYTISVIVLNAIQIHLFTHPGYATDTSCVVFYILLRVAGGIAVWAIEIIMQLRIYALFGCSSKIAIFNALLFFTSILSCLGIIIYNGVLRQSVIASAVHLPLLGCPVINGGIQWAEWVPTTIYESILFSFVLFKLFQQGLMDWRNNTVSMFNILIKDNMLYFFGVTFVLIFNNLMVAGKTHIPWFSLGPFYASLGIMTSRMVLHLHRSQQTDANLDVVVNDFNFINHTTHTLPPLAFSTTPQGSDF